MSDDKKDKKNNKEAGKEANDLKKQLEDCEKKAAEYLAGWQRERADFLNYKKDEVERIGQLMGFAKEEFVLGILPILDNFEQAEQEIHKIPNSDEVEATLMGFVLIKTQLVDFLKKLGVGEIKTMGQKFDPKVHEIVEEKPFDAAQGQKSGEIFEEVQKGYKINGRLLRPARVKVVK